MDDLATRVRRASDGDTEAWRALQGQLEPTILAMARRHHGLRKARLADLPDDLAEVRTATFERLSRANFQNLRDFLQRNADNADDLTSSFDTWVYGTVDFVIREHLRNRFGRAPKLPADGSGPVRPSKQDLQSKAGRLDDAVLERAFLATLGMTMKLTLGEVFAHIQRDFNDDEARAMRLYYAEERSFDEVAHALGLADAKAAEKLIRRLNARLRYRFSQDSEST